MSSTVAELHRGRQRLDGVLGELSTGVASDGPLRFDVARAGEHVRLELNSRPANTGQLGLQLQPVTFGLVVKHSFWLIGKLIVAPVIIVQQLAAKVLNPDLVKASMSGHRDHANLRNSDGIGQVLYIVA